TPEPRRSGSQQVEQTGAKPGRSHLPRCQSQPELAPKPRLLLTARPVGGSGLSIPGDLAMVSYDDEGAEFAEIPLTAVSPPKRRLGRLAAEILLHRLKPGGLKPRHQI